MPIANVSKFAKRVLQDPELRRRCNRAPDNEAREAILEELELPFTDAEFEEAVRALHVQCQTEEEAGQLLEFAGWWEFLRRGY